MRKILLTICFGLIVSVAYSQNDGSALDEMQAQLREAANLYAQIDRKRQAIADTEARIDSLNKEWHEICEMVLQNPEASANLLTILSVSPFVEKGSKLYDKLCEEAKNRNKAEELSGSKSDTKTNDSEDTASPVEQQGYTKTRIPTDW